MVVDHEWAWQATVASLPQFRCKVYLEVMYCRKMNGSHFRWPYTPERYDGLEGILEKEVWLPLWSPGKDQHDLEAIAEAIGTWKSWRISAGKMLRRWFVQTTLLYVWWSVEWLQNYPGWWRHWCLTATFRANKKIKQQSVGIIKLL